jgi:hypothetical protein
LLLLHCRAAEDASGAARVLIESMQVQCKVYAEWIEVMSDYSTVFSENRGVAENYYSEETAEEGGDAASSATVRSHTVVFVCLIDASVHFSCRFQY